ncbi:MAG: hypothetical protein B6242_00075 [Anaerolineaceae bacterium 4572_78]|nr:MAG: hypothetical protein B6242_00075 [Anaerolineaceae bacterium 4572_78]
MNWSLIYEIIGYTASVLIAVSMMMSSIIRLRIINLIGAFFFTLYGLLISAYPVAALNFFIVLINIYYLHKMFTSKEYFTFLESEKDSPYIKYFLGFHKQEITFFFPDFSYEPTKNLLTFFTLRDIIPAGLFIAEIMDDHTLFVTLDFVMPGYRDFAIDRFIYVERSDFLTDKGFNNIYTKIDNDAHVKHLQKIGFKFDDTKGDGTLYLKLGK